MNTTKKVENIVKGDVIKYDRKFYVYEGLKTKDAIKVFSKVLLTHDNSFSLLRLGDSEVVELV